MPGKNITFTIDFNDDNDAIVKFPEGKGQQRNAAEVAKLTEELGKLLGKIEERHVGDHHHHNHATNDNRNHETA